MTSEPGSGRTVPGVGWVLFATAGAGVAGYGIQVVASATLDDPGLYIAFGTFWSAMYVMVTLLSGIQNAVTRAVRPAGTAREDGVAGAADLAVLAAVVVGALAVLAGSVVVIDGTDGPVGGAAGWMLLAGTGYVGVTLVGGVLQGLQRWRAVAGLTLTDSAVRTLLVVSALLMTAARPQLFAAMALPFLVAAVAVGLATWSRGRGRFTLDVGRGELVRQVLGAVVASSALGVMVSGMPAVMAAVSRDTTPQRLAELVMVTSLARAPLIVPILALQGFLLVRFRDGHDRAVQVLRRGGSLILVVTVVAAGAAAAVGPAVLDTVTGGSYAIEPWFVAGVVVGAGLLGVQVLVGSALLGRSHHRDYVTMWTVSAVATVLLVLVPGSLGARSLLSMIGGPLAGMAIAAVLRRVAAADRGSSPAGR
ncbi:hypothetical protein HMPREF0063_12990 [Aeromicrobium marinum DSM 15272]|uniref:Uncharacterized protein n=1 Tax=Aeromicrobium marinum DSM 15272 TaxID=585531 RepID=E2SG31_9ACTN|nr:hypothetical protein [Aeromicrobium marinum]EFQ81788.1 hypothetical protein HMPREF0063_12990 [Aeromicrobium marinum DSM 15272]